ncbi:MAG: hypothetical protein RML46_09440 [Anaerolineae bacterium]|nr:hypothetical protein [Anaerolineae bacterium]MDW8069124.1 hypothetical protein [Anaerolineae bacterium]
MAERIPRLNRDRLSVLIALILLTSVLLRFIQLPQVTRRLHLLGSPLEVNLTGTGFLVILVAGLAAAGARYVLMAHPDAPDRLPRPLYLSWVLPGLLGGMAAYLVELAPAEALWVGGLFLAMVLIGWAVAAEFAALSPRHPAATRARLGLNILAYLLALAFFYLIYRTRARSLVTATGVTLVAFLVALDLLGVAETRARRVALYAAIIGLIVGEATWALNYWRVDNWTGSLILLLFFYLTTGIVQQYLMDRLKPAVLLEFGLVTAAVLVLVLMAGRR